MNDGKLQETNRKPTVTWKSIRYHYCHHYITLHYYYFFLHETSSVKNQYNDIKDKIEKKKEKKWTVLPEGRVSVLCSWHFQLVRCAFSSFLKHPSVWISLILAK